MADDCTRNNYYANPAFCQQSEFYHFSKNQSNLRQPPVGAQSPIRVVREKPRQKYGDNDNYHEQEFYEEILVDEVGLVTQKKVVVIQSPPNLSPQRYQFHPIKQNHRYEYIPMQKHEDPNHNQSYKHEDNHRGTLHRYSIIPGDYDDDEEEETELVIRNQSHPHTPTRYPLQIEEIKPKSNPKATQKLHEILSTPKKIKAIPQSPPKKYIYETAPPPPLPSREPFMTSTPQKNQQQRLYTRERTPKAQQKLNYALSTRQGSQNKRTTAIVAPICSSPLQTTTVYSETTIANKSESWMNLSGHKQPVHVTLTVAAVMMMLCGGVTSCLCFYMISFMGRLYFLDFGIVSGFSCLVLGVLGCRSRNYYYWLPNRNYMSGTMDFLLLI